MLSPVSYNQAKIPRSPWHQNAMVSKKTLESPLGRHASTFKGIQNVYKIKPKLLIALNKEYTYKKQVTTMNYEAFLKAAL